MSNVYVRAREFVLTQGRPLDRARLLFHFESGPAGVVLAELAAYQNEDGGCGRALEPDLRTPVSSAVATWTACNVLHEIGADGGEPVVRVPSGACSTPTIPASGAGGSCRRRRTPRPGSAGGRTATSPVSSRSSRHELPIFAKA